MHSVFIALGSNVGERLQNLRDAVAQLAPEVAVSAESSVYETEPWGYEEQDDFLNMVVHGETELEPDELLAHLKRIEDNVGRTKTFRNGPREIDLDILFYDDLIQESEGLVIPHPRMHERAFVLVPLADIAPELVHPIWNQKIAELLSNVGQKEIHAFHESTILDPNEPFVGINGLTVNDYWAWAYSDLLGNTNRGLLAEFIVGTLLDEVSKPRIQWDKHDLIYKNKLLEIKSSAYLQSWHQQEPSKIIFDIAKKRSWDAKTNTFEDIATRSADCFVFCIHSEKEIAKANPLNLHQWVFYVLSTKYIDRAFANQKSVALSVLQNHAQATEFAGLKSHVDEIFGF